MYRDEKRSRQLTHSLSRPSTRSTTTSRHPNFPISQLKSSQILSPSTTSFTTSFASNRSLTGLSSANSRHINTSVNQSSSSFIDSSSGHLIQSYGSLLPVLVIEAISSEVVSFGSLSVKISPSGWAWLVCGRRLFVWKYKQTQPNRVSNCPCYELQLPPSDLAHKAELVCVFANNEKLSQSQPSQLPSTIAVSPEGIVRYWPNIAYEGHSIEVVVADLQGQECISLTNIQPLGCILGTSTSSLVHVTVSNVDGQNAIVCRTLKVPQGVLAGFSRKVSSFIFGAIPAGHSTETKQLIKVLHDTFSKPSDIEDEESFYVLAGCCIQKWEISQQTERLLYDFDFERLIRDAFLDRVWNRETTHPNQLQIWPIDIALKKSGDIVLLVAGLNADVSNQLYYALAVLSDATNTNLSINTTPASMAFVSFTVLRNHTVCYTEEDEEQLLNLRLLTGTINSQAVYIYNHSRILCVQFGSEEVYVIDFENRDDGILGAGICDGIPLLFTHKDALVSVVPHRQDISDIMDISRIEIEITEDSDGILGKLKKAFLLHMKKEPVRSQALLSEALVELSTSTDNELDEALLTISAELCDEFPINDPRWAESTTPINSSAVGTTASVIIINQLEEKMRMHRLMIEYFKNSVIWERLSTVTIRGTTMATQLVLCEHAEKLVAAMTLRKLHIEYNNMLESAILIVLRQRNVTIPSRLTAQDVFYREVTRIGDLIPTLIEFEFDQINNSLSASRDVLDLILSVSDIFITLFQDVCRFRKAQGTLFESTNFARSEYIPWSSTIGNEGIRTALLKQLDIIINYGIELINMPGAISDDIQLKGVVYQRFLELADIILDSYICQLKSIDNGSERYRIVERNYESDRLKCLRPLMNARQFERASALAEKYEDFDTLIRVCEELDNRERLQRYMIDFSHKGFSDFLFKWYLKEGKQGKMLTTTSNTQMLSSFLKDYNQLNWLHQLHLEQYEASGKTLKELALNEKRYLSRKKTLLSLSKLSALASGETEAVDIDMQLDLISYQETLPVTVLEAFNLDPQTMRVLTPKELIEMYISEANADADEVDFKKALDLISFISEHDTKDIEEKENIRLHIWANAILRDSWENLSTDNPMDSIKDTIFLRVVGLAFSQGDDLNDFLPSCDDLVKSSELSPLSQNTTFTYLIKAAYEYIASLNQL